MEIEDILKIIRQELIKQAKRHDVAASQRIKKYQESFDCQALNDALRVAFTGQALGNFSEALTLEHFHKWRKEQGE